MKTSRRFTRLGQQPPNKGKRRWRIALLILAIFLLGVGILFKLRWHAWFGNVPEAPYTTEQAISRVTLTPGEDFISQRTITWLAGEQARPAELLLRPIGKQRRHPASHLLHPHDRSHRLPLRTWLLLPSASR